MIVRPAPVSIFRPWLRLVLATVAWWYVAILAGSWLPSFLVGIAAGFLTALGRAEPASAGGAFVWATAILTSFALGTIAVWRARRRFGPDWRRCLGLRRVPPSARLIGLVALILAGYWLWGFALALISAKLAGSGAPIAFLLGRLPQGAVGLYAVWIAAVAPAAEEVFFRGYVQGRAQSLLPAWIAVATSTVLFGLAHYEGAALRPLVVLPLGLAAGLLRLRTGSLWPGLALHAANNLAGLAVLLAGI